MPAADSLITGESIVFESGKHWVSALSASRYAVAMVLGAIVLSLLIPGTGGGFVAFVRELTSLTRWILLVAGIAWIAYNVVVWRTAVFTVTSLRVLRHEGLLRRRSSETMLAAVSDVRVGAGFIGRSLGFGDIRITTGVGDAGMETFTAINDPAGFRNAMTGAGTMDHGIRQAATVPGRPVPPVPTVRPVPAPVPVAGPRPVAPPVPVATPAHLAADDVVARLVRLAELRDRGLVTPAEFDAKKAEILARM